MSRRVREQIRPMLAIAGLALVALLVAGYILHNQRVRSPFGHDYTLRVRMPTGQALAPGQGQAATVAGVKVGEVAKVTLRDGVALVDLRLDPSQLPRRDLRTDAHLLLRPRTPLLDMTVDIDPGTPAAAPLAAGVILDASHTSANVNLDEIEASLDSDTRAWTQTMLQAGGRGLHDRGTALREAFRAGAPTLAASRRVSDAVAGRRRELARAVHNLRLLSGALAQQDTSVARLVEGGDATFSALAGESAALRSTVAQLPGTLDSASSAVAALTPLADATGPALRSLLPTAKALPAALQGVRPLLRDGAPALVATSTLTGRAAPVVRDLGRALALVDDGVPDLTTTFSVLRRLTDEFTHVPGGKNRSALFSLAWFAHNGNSLVSPEDANGVFWHGSSIVSCSAQLNDTALTQVIGPILKQAAVCPASPGAG